VIVYVQLSSVTSLVLGPPNSLLWYVPFYFLFLQEQIKGIIIIYMELGSYFLSLQEQIKDIIIITSCCCRQRPALFYFLLRSSSKA
jgi:hypothetical protein